MSFLLPTDANGNAMQVAGFAYRGTQKLAVDDESVAVPIPAGMELVSLVATGPCRFEVGSPEVAADLLASPFLYPGTYVDVPLRRNQTHIAFIAEGDPCVVFVIGRN